MEERKWKNENGKLKWKKENRRMKMEE